MVNWFKKISLSKFSLIILAVLFPVVSKAQIAYKIESFITPTSFAGLLESILSAFIVVATPIIVLAIIYAGFLYVSAKGNAEQIKKATTALTYAVIGGVLIIGAVAIGQIIQTTVDSFSS